MYVINLKPLYRLKHNAGNIRYFMYFIANTRKCYKFTRFNLTNRFETHALNADVKIIKLMIELSI